MYLVLHEYRAGGRSATVFPPDQADKLLASIKGTRPTIHKVDDDAAEVTADRSRLLLTIVDIQLAAGNFIKIPGMPS